MHKSKIKQISLAVCLALLPLSSYAAGLGKLNVNSGIGEPLKAEIELLSVTPEELSTLAASIASEDAYAQQGIPRLGIHNNIKVEIAKNVVGSPILKIRSNQPVSDPYLDMLIQVDWATGRLQREYTVLLDPPGYKPDASSSIPVTLPSSNGTTNANATQSALPDNVVENSQNGGRKLKKQKKLAPVIQSEKVQQEVVSEPVKTDAQTLTTKRGDTLIAVAKEMQVEGVSLDQMLVGLFETNQDAFTQGNMNRLKVGQIIKVPSKEVLTSIGNQQARKTIKIHSANWNAYRNALASNVEAAPAKAEAEQKQSTAGKIATAEDKATPAALGPKDVVKLSARDKAGAKGSKDGANSAEAKLQALQEETTARENSLKEANDKTAALEKQIADMQKLIAMKSQAMTEMQKNAEVAVKKPEATETAKAEVKTDAVPVAAAVPEVKPAEVKPTEPVAVVAPAAKPEVKKVTPTPIPVTAVEEPSFIAGLLNSVDLAVMGGIGGVALLGAGWMFLRNKRRKDLDSFERGILTSGGLRANTVFGNTTGNASMSDTSFLTDFAQSADGSMIDTNDVDPIAEAEVYMAYGRDAQAEEILKDAISKEPKRYELHLKLLELYAARKDTSAFEAIAGELYTTLGADDPTWAKVAAMGSDLEPGNPLYNQSSSLPVQATSLISSEVSKLAVADSSDTALESDSGLDFSFSEDVNSAASAAEPSAAGMESFTEANADESEISFDMGSLDDVSSTEKSIADEVDSSEEASNLMDFDLGEFATKATPVAASMATLVAPAAEMTANAMEFNAPDIDAVPEADLADVKLPESIDTSSTDFDMDFNLPSESEVIALDSASSSKPNAIEEISFDLNFPEDVSAKSSEPPMAMDASEISFDFPSIDEPAVEKSAELNNSEEFEPNALDLSMIDLNLGDAESELAVESSVNKESSSKDTMDSPDVNIKLDLVAAYIDMDDKEGARELLEEILIEGGTNQQARAKELLASLV